MVHKYLKHLDDFSSGFTQCDMLLIFLTFLTSGMLVLFAVSHLRTEKIGSQHPSIHALNVMGVMCLISDYR